MYLGRFPVNSLAGFPGQGDPFSPDFFTVNVGVDPDDCRARGGVPSYTDSTRTNPSASELIPYAQRQQKVRTWTCQIPPTQANPPISTISVNVPTAVQTTVSPQVSPVFVQQDEPRNSPVNAATVQESPAPQSASFDPAAPQYSPVPQGSSVDTRNAMFDDYLQKMMEQDALDAARGREWLELYTTRPAQSLPVNYGSGGGAPAFGPAVSIPYPAAQNTAPPDNSLRNGLIIAVAGVALSAYISKRRKGK